MATEINMPTEESFRNHINMVLSYMLIHLSLTELEELPELGLKEVLDPKIAKRVFDRLAIFPRGKPMRLTLSEALMIYSAHVCMNKLLVSKFDETITPTILENLPEGHEYKSFEFFRSEMLDINSHFIRNSEISLGDKKSLHHLKNKLAAIVID